MTDWQMSTPPASAPAEEPNPSPVRMKLFDEIEHADEQPKPPPPLTIRTPTPRPLAYDFFALLSGPAYLALPTLRVIDMGMTEEAAAEVEQEARPSRTCARLVAEANRAGGWDNITALVLALPDERGHQRVVAPLPAPGK